VAYSTANLYQVGSVWYFRLWIPQDLKPYFNRQEIKRTLRTKSLTIAKQLLKLYSAKTEKVFTMIRTGMLTNTQIKELIEDYITYRLEKNDERRQEYGVETCTVQTDSGPVEVGTREYDAVEFDYIRSELESEQYGLISKMLDEFLVDVSVQVDKESPQYKQLCRDIALAHLEKVHHIDCRRDENDYSDPYYLREWKPEAKKKQQPVEQLPANPQGLLLSELIGAYVKESVARGNWTDKTRQETQSILESFHELLGDPDVKTITKPVMVDCLDKMQRLPARRQQLAEYRDKTIDELLALPSVPNPLSVQTIKKRFTMISSLFKWAVDNDYMMKNPASGLAPKDKRAADEQRQAYTHENLQKLINILNLKYRDKADRPDRWWIPLIALYNGLRMNEICQLYKEDIKQIDGIWCFDVNNKKDKKVKNRNSIRTVPVHKELLNLGFIEYYKTVDHERLWPDLHKGPQGYAHDFSRWFQKVNRRHITDDTGQVFHSLRHNFTNSLKQAGVQEQQIGELVGHKSGSITMERYGKKYEPAVLFEAIKKLDYRLTF